MKNILAPMVIAAMLTATAHAENWVVFVPTERDFRVLLPEPPVRAIAPDGSTIFRARVERRDYEISFTVYRLPAGSRPLGDPRAEIQQRLQARTPDDERGVRYVRDDGSDGSWDRHVFRRGPRAISVHRLVGQGGRYFELEVSMPRGSPELAVHTARDFFNSFQVTGEGLPSLGTIAERIDTWCQGRTDSFSRAFCQYSVCLQPGYEKHAHCSALSGLTHFF